MFQRMRMPLVQTGGSFKVNLPNYVMVTCDYGLMEAIVDVPLSDLPAEMRTLKAGDAANIGGVQTRTKIAASDKTAWQKTLADRYPNKPAYTLDPK